MSESFFLTHWLLLDVAWQLAQAPHSIQHVASILLEAAGVQPLALHKHQQFL
jgi:hypothetical protein